MINPFALAILAAFTIYWEKRKPHYWHYILKPLTTLTIITIAFSNATPGFTIYADLILAGLIFSLSGDIFLMLPQDRFLPGLVSFLLAHIVYSLAFLQATNDFTLWIIIPLLLYGAWMYWQLLPRLGKMRYAVLVYILLILLMAGSAINLWWQQPTRFSLMAGLGAIFFVVSDSILAWNRFKQASPRAGWLILSTYFIAQLLIAVCIPH